MGRIILSKTDAEMSFIFQRKSPLGLRLLSKLLLLFLFFILICLVLVPWQQSVTGSGRVIAYAPIDRQQYVEAPIEGRLTKWYVSEGSHIEQGDLIAEISDNDPKIIERLNQEREALEKRINSIQTRKDALGKKVESLQESKRSALSAASVRLKIADQKIIGGEQSILAAKAAQIASQKEYDRKKVLYEKGISSGRSFDIASADLAKTDAEQQKQNAFLTAAKDEKQSLKLERDKMESDFETMITEAMASLSQSEADLFSAQVELTRLQVKLSRQQTYQIKSPRTGYILKLLAHPNAEMLKMSEPLAILVPDTVERAAELWIDGNDIPLLSQGRKVRLQFEGWPAVQFTGWPSVAVGTFGGVVSLIDSTDDGRGNFRILVTPDPLEPWPESRYLRQGVRVNGWVLLNRVRLGYELWRQFNGFPPALEGPTKLESPINKSK